MSFGKRGITVKESIPVAEKLTTSLAVTPEPQVQTSEDAAESQLSEEDRVLGETYIGEAVVPLHIMDARHRLMEPDETLLGAFHGTALAREAYGITAERKGGFAVHDYLLVTDRRVVLWARGIFKQSVDSVSYDDISSVEATNGLLLGEIVLNIRGAKERFANMVTRDTPVAERMIRANIRAQRTAQPGRLPESQRDPLQQMFDNLERLGAMKDKGLITEDEFNNKRQKIIDEV